MTHAQRNKFLEKQPLAIGPEVRSYTVFSTQKPCFRIVYYSRPHKHIDFDMVAIPFEGKRELRKLYNKIGRELKKKYKRPSIS